MKKLFYNHYLAVLLFSISLFGQSMIFAADASSDEATATPTQENTNHYHIIVDNQSSAHFECLLIQSDISRLRIVSRALSYCFSGERKRCPAGTETPIILSKITEDEEIKGYISFALIDLNAWKSFGESTKRALTQASETAVKVSALSGGACAVGLDPSAALSLLPVATASAQSLQESAIKTKTTLAEATKKYPFSRKGFTLSSSQPIVGFVITDGDDESGNIFTIKNVIE